MTLTVKRLRLVLASAGLVALWACNERKIQTPTPLPTGTTQNFFEQNINNELDILFMVDDSSSMMPVQTNLIQNFPVFINVLKSLPAGLPNVHVAVTTSNMGAGAFTSSVPGCMTPDLGNFVTTNRSGSTCPPTNASCAAARITSSDKYVSSSGNNTMNNFSGDISDVFCCMAQVGANACGFEHQLESVRAALGDPAGDASLGVPPRPVPTGNTGFLRDNAFLAVIWITNEDDCSAPPDSQLFDPNQTMVSDPLGPLASYRCTEFGILCNGAKPPRTATGPLSNCLSNDGAIRSDHAHALIPAQFYINYFQRLKTLPNHIIAAAVAAPVEPFQVFIDSMSQFPTLQHSCSSSNMTFGDPGVRLKQVIDSFGDLGTYTSICQNSYADAIRVIAEKIGRQLGRQCIDGVLASKASNFTMPLSPLPANGAVVDPNTVDCSVEDVQYIGSSRQMSAGKLSPCNTAGQASGACWALVGDTMCTASGAKVVVCRNGYNPSDAMKPCPDGPNMAPDGDTAVIHCATIAM
jgi:hypothetical protein